MLETYWPQADAVNACIKNEAETADVSVLLAVHQPTPLIARAAVSNRETPATEKQLLDAFLSDDIPGGYLLCPITGPSGVGKSHVIRWLDAQLQRSARYDKLLVIRIPKSASLRKVVELILAPLADNPRYAKPREELSKAVAEVNADQVIVRFVAELENALADRAKEMRALVAQDPSRGAELRPLTGHAEQLPKLFRDAVLRDYYANTVFSRIVSRAIKGRDEDAVGGESDSQFFADDLLVPDTVEIGDSALPVRTYYLSQIAVADAGRREPIAKLLNSVVDRAIGHVFRLEQSSGGLTLQDIILGVRETLFEEGKDLVLLVEDFAALAGIQEALLNVCIQEGTHNGEKVRATMRTALALTDGYLTSRETILTRAQRVWVIGNPQQSEKDINAAVVEMVGAYLNAARWGETRLKARFNPKRSSSTGWLPAWEDEGRTEDEAAALDAFGHSAAGHPLFPFNREAIERLTAQHLVEGGRLSFNPRRVINEILRNTLLDRQSFVGGSFPPAQYHGLQPNAFLAGLVRQTSVPDPTKKRLLSALAIWGGDAPEARLLAQIPPLVFRSFGLPTPEDLTRLKHEKKADPLPPSGRGARDLEPGKPLSPTPVAQDPRIAAWVSKLDGWASGATLTQSDARELRNALASMLQKSVNWSGLRIPHGDIRGASLWIAGASNNPTVGRILTVCKEQRDEDGALRQGLLGALRFNYQGSQWDYPDADDDYVASMAIIEELRFQLEPILISEAKTALHFLGGALMTQARIAGLEPPLRIAGPEGVLAGLFDLSPVSDGASAEPNWDQLRAHALGAGTGRDVRALLQESLRDRSAGYQGDGKKSFAIDAVRIFDALSLEIAAGTPLPEGLPEELRTFLTTVSDIRIWRFVQPIIELLQTFRKEIGEFLGDGKLDKNAFVNDLKEIVPLLQRTQCWPSQANFNVATFEKSLNEFQTSPVVDLVGKITTIVDEANREQLPKLLNALGTMDLGLIKRMLSFLEAADQLVTAAAPRVTKQEEARKQSDPNVVAEQITALFDRIAVRTNNLEPLP